MSPEQDYNQILGGFELEADSDQYPEVTTYDPDLIANIADVLLTKPGDNLEARMSGHEDDEDVVLQVEDWRTLSSDDPKGELMNCRVPAGMVRKIDYLISKTRGSVWVGKSDFMREAIWTYLRSVIGALQTNDPDLITIIAEAELAGRAKFHNTRRKRLEEAMTDFAGYLTDLVNLDDYEEAHRSFLDMAYRLRKLHVLSWRRQWLISLNSLPIVKVVARVLDMNGWDLPIEFYPAAGKSPLASILPPLTPLVPTLTITTPAPPSPVFSPAIGDPT